VDYLLRREEGIFSDLSFRHGKESKNRSRSQTHRRLNVVEMIIGSSVNNKIGKRAK